MAIERGLAEEFFSVSGGYRGELSCMILRVFMSRMSIAESYLTNDVLKLNKDWLFCYGESTAEVTGYSPSLCSGQRPVFEVTDTLEVRTGFIQGGNSSACQWDHERLGLADRMGHDKPLQPRERVHLEDREDTGVR